MGCNCGKSKTATVYEVRYSNGIVKRFVTEAEATAAQALATRQGLSATVIPPS